MVIVSGFKKSGSVQPATKIIKATPAAHKFDMRMFGMDLKTQMDNMEQAKRIETAIGNGDRPSNIWYKMTNRSHFWYMYAIMDWHKTEVSVLSTVFNRFVWELFRYGLKMKPKFAFKCVDCGHETDNIVTECPACHSLHIRKPEEAQLDYFKRPNGKSFLEEANDNGQSLEDVLRQYAGSQIQNNQCYNVCVTGDIYDKETGELLSAYPLEFIAYDPKFVRYLYDETGKPGMTYAFRRDDRNTLISIENKDLEGLISDSEGKRLTPAFWQVGSSYGGTGNYWLYSSDEVYQDHWFEPSLTYGRPIWFDIEDDLFTYHYIEKHNLKKYKYGYIRKMIILPGFEDEDVREITKGIKDILATNDNSIPIVCTPPGLPHVAEMKAQTLELGAESSSDLMAIKDDIRDRICAHGGLPNIFAGDVEASGGMNNESQQITIFDRYLLGPYNFVDRQLKWIMSWFPQITDYELILDRPTRAFTDQKKRLDKIQEAMAMKQLGFEISYYDGDFHYSAEPMDQIMRKQQMKTGVAQGGIFPGDGEGPPEKGTARRENDEIAVNKDDIDQTKRDSDGAMTL